MDGRGATGELGLVCPHRAGAFAAPQPAAADTATTAAIVAGAAAIVGALVYDANNRPYYVRNGHRYYVTPQEAQYPVARDPYHNNHGDRH